MKDVSNIDYKIIDDMNLVMESEMIDIENLSKLTHISKTTLHGILKHEKVGKDVSERFYSYVYSIYSLNKAKEELVRETYNLPLFHGSKEGLSHIRHNGSRNNCDFGNGFYLGETYENALNFVCENENSSVYSFCLSLEHLNVLRFECDLEWMLAICFYRGRLDEYKDSETIRSIVNKIEQADVIIAPIADNRMYYIMSLFVEGDINVDVAIHSLSTSNMGMQYIIKTEKALSMLTPIEKYYLTIKEKSDCHDKLEKRTREIEAKLKLAKREYRNGKFIDEVLL